MTGAERIAAERKRQIEQEGWTPEHDAQHNRGELSNAALCYLATATMTIEGSAPEPASQAAAADVWPWHERWWKPSDDPIRNLEKAGALIAAEIDRLQGHRIGG